MTFVSPCLPLSINCVGILISHCCRKLRIEGVLLYFYSSVSWVCMKHYTCKSVLRLTDSFLFSSGEPFKILQVVFPKAARQVWLLTYSAANKSLTPPLHLIFTSTVPFSLGGRLHNYLLVVCIPRKLLPLLYTLRAPMFQVHGHLLFGLFGYPEANIVFFGGFWLVVCFWVFL